MAWYSVTYDFIVLILCTGTLQQQSKPGIIHTDDYNKFRLTVNLMYGTLQ